MRLNTFKDALSFIDSLITIQRNELIHA